MPVNTPGGGLVRGAAVGAGAKSDDPGGNLLFVGALHILTCLVCGGPKASRQRAAPRASTRGGAGVRGLTWHEGFKGAVLVGGGVAVLCACRCLSGAYADMCPCFQHIWGKPICMGVVAVHRWRARTACDDCCASAGCTGACPQDCKAGRPAADRVLPASVMNPRGRRGVGEGTLRPLLFQTAAVNAARCSARSWHRGSCGRGAGGCDNEGGVPAYVPHADNEGTQRFGTKAAGSGQRCRGQRAAGACRDELLIGA